MQIVITHQGGVRVVYDVTSNTEIELRKTENVDGLNHLKRETFSLDGVEALELVHSHFEPEAAAKAEAQAASQQAEIDDANAAGDHPPAFQVPTPNEANAGPVKEEGPAEATSTKSFWRF